MSKVVAESVVKLVIGAGKATPTPPIGPALGAKGVKSIDFCKEFNARTAHLIADTPCSTVITISPDRTFKFHWNSPPVTYFIKKCVGKEKLANEPGKETIGTISLKEVYEIAKIKHKDPHMTHLPLVSIVSGIIGQCRSCGVKVVH